MARGMVGNAAGVTAKAGKNYNGGNDSGAGFNNNNIQTIDAARARLTAISATSYTTARLDAMTFNDMIYAIRAHDAAGTVR